MDENTPPNKKGFIRQLLDRYDQDSPEFFKRFYRFGRVLCALSGGLLGAAIAPNIKAPEYLLTIASCIGVCGATIMLVSKASTTKEDCPIDDQAKKTTEDEK